MKQILDFIPLILFFVVYKLFGVREASIALVAATVVQLLVLKIYYGQIEKQQKILTSAVIFFGVLSAYFNDLEYLKWKVTIINGLFAAVLLISQFVFHTPLIKKLLGKELHLPDQVWNHLNLGWAGFFLLCMGLNLYISHYMSENMWVNFKSFGLLGMTLCATLITGIYIYRYLPKNEGEQ